MDKEVISKFLYDYFLALDDPPPSRLLVPTDKIELDGDTARATLIYVYEGDYEKVHKVRIEFDPLRLDSVNFDTCYQYIS